jgi:hypothetical protein
MPLFIGRTILETECRGKRVVKLEALESFRIIVMLGRNYVFRSSSPASDFG